MIRAAWVLAGLIYVAGIIAAVVLVVVNVVKTVTS